MTEVDPNHVPAAAIAAFIKSWGEPLDPQCVQGAIAAALSAWPWMRPVQMTNYRRPDGLTEFGISAGIILPLREPPNG